MEKREIYILQKQQTKNFIFPVVIASCLRTEMFLIEYHKVDQSLNMKTCNLHYHKIHYHNLNCFEKADEDTTIQVAFFFWNYMVLFP